MPGADDWADLNAANTGKIIAQVAVPAILCGVLAGYAFCPAALGLRDLLAATTQEVLKGDMTQYMQNAFTILGLLFVLLLGITFDFLLNRQERLYTAIFSEVTQAQVLMEQMALLGADRGPGFGMGPDGLFGDLDEYLREDLGKIGQPGLLSKRIGGAVDPLERLLFATSVGMPSDICDTVRSLRQARCERLAAVQRRFPLGHSIILATYGFVTVAVFLIVGAGLAGFEAPGEADLPGHAVAMLSPYFGLLITAISLMIALLLDLADPASGLYGVRPVLERTLSGLSAELRTRRDWREYSSRVAAEET